MLVADSLKLLYLRVDLLLRLLEVVVVKLISLHLVGHKEVVPLEHILVPEALFALFRLFALELGLSRVFLEEAGKGDFEDFKDYIAVKNRLVGAQDDSLVDLREVAQDLLHNLVFWIFKLRIEGRKPGAR